MAGDVVAFKRRVRAFYGLLVCLFCRHERVGVWSGGYAPCPGCDEEATVPESRADMRVRG